MALLSQMICALSLFKVTSPAAELLICPLFLVFKECVCILVEYTYCCWSGCLFLCLLLPVVLLDCCSSPPAPLGLLMVAAYRLDDDGLTVKLNEICFVSHCCCGFLPYNSSALLASILYRAKICPNWINQYSEVYDYDGAVLAEQPSFELRASSALSS